MEEGRSEVLWGKYLTVTRRKPRPRRVDLFIRTPQWEVRREKSNIFFSLPAALSLSSLVIRPTVLHISSNFLPLASKEHLTPGWASPEGGPPDASYNPCRTHIYGDHKPSPRALLYISTRSVRLCIYTQFARRVVKSAQPRRSWGRLRFLCLMIVWRCGHGHILVLTWGGVPFIMNKVYVQQQRIVLFLVCPELNPYSSRTRFTVSKSRV
jgi:hypothetical protein